MPQYYHAQQDKQERTLTSCLPVGESFGCEVLSHDFFQKKESQERQRLRHSQRFFNVTAYYCYFPDLTANWKTIAIFMQALLHSFEHKGLSLGLSGFARACEQFAVHETLGD